MKHFYILIALLFVSTLGNAQNNFAKEQKQKMLDFTQKFIPQQQLKSAAANPYALDKLSYENGAYKEMTYNADGQLLTFKGYENEDGTIYLDDKETNNYNQNGQLLTNVISRYDRFAEKMVDQWKYENFYDAQNRIVSEISYVVEDDAPYALINDNKTEYKYMEDGTVEATLYNWWDGWSLDTKQIMYVRWESQNVPTVDSIKGYVLMDSESDTWSHIGVINFVYNELGQLTEINSTSFDEKTGEVNSKMKEETVYNNNGYVLSESTKRYNPDEMEWVTVLATEYEYEAETRLIQEQDYSLSWSTGLLAPSFKTTYQYDTKGNLEIREDYLPDYDNGGVMMVYNKYLYKYKELNTENIMLPPAETGYYSSGYEFYDIDYYLNGAIAEVQHYGWDYQTEAIELEKTGTYHYSEYKGIGTSAKQINDLSIRVFPNPFTNEIKLQLDKAGEYQLKIRNSIGQVVYSTNINDATTSHNVSDLPGGLYILSVFSEGENIENYKILKQ
jgi:virulence-associated protein VapD